MEKIEQIKKEIELLKIENKVLTRQVDKLAETLADVSDCMNCKTACPIGNPLDCNCECFDANVWKEWCLRDGGERKGKEMY